MNGPTTSYNHEVEVTVQYERVRNENGGARPHINALTRQCKVSWSYARKVEREILSHGTVVASLTLKECRNDSVGLGSKMLSRLDVFIVIMLYHQEPSYLLRSYLLTLFLDTGILVHTSTVLRFHTDGFKIRDSLFKPSMVP